MAERNRVTPYGQIVASPLRGAWMGNRGCIHRGREIVRQSATRRWITCALSYKGWVAPKWTPNRWTALFFYDEAVALAAGHRPCALCRRADYKRYMHAAQMPGADAADERLHAERLEAKQKRLHRLPWTELPSGAFVEFGGEPHVVLPDAVMRWSETSGYVDTIVRPKRGDAVVITPLLSIEAIQRGYQPQIAGL
ncbi:MAG TPA: hypothetical protein VFL13_15025 [Candidatus Baltobacteraceae bacterium]|nr:hypothetical protein [Candidatus Baltobacteraceae bacterium]